MPKDGGGSGVVTGNQKKTQKKCEAWLLTSRVNNLFIVTHTQSLNNHTGQNMLVSKKQVRQQNAEKREMRMD